ncbi:MAG: hypothetical protein AAB267_05250, partial [Candidatus Desantisbacteria bacterium]
MTIPTQDKPGRNLFSARLLGIEDKDGEHLGATSAYRMVYKPETGKVELVFSGTGFIDFNYPSYPNKVNLVIELGDLEKQLSSWKNIETQLKAGRIAGISLKEAAKSINELEKDITKRRAEIAAGGIRNYNFSQRVSLRTKLPGDFSLTVDNTYTRGRYVNLSPIGPFERNLTRISFYPSNYPQGKVLNNFYFEYLYGNVFAFDNWKNFLSKGRLSAGILFASRDKDGPRFTSLDAFYIGKGIGIDIEARKRFDAGRGIQLTPGIGAIGIKDTRGLRGAFRAELGAVRMFSPESSLTGRVSGSTLRDAELSIIYRQNREAGVRDGWNIAFGLGTPGKRAQVPGQIPGAGGELSLGIYPRRGGLLDYLYVSYARSLLNNKYWSLQLGAEIVLDKAKEAKQMPQQAPTVKAASAESVQARPVTEPVPLYELSEQTQKPLPSIPGRKPGIRLSDVDMKPLLPVISEEGARLINWQRDRRKLDELLRQKDGPLAIAVDGDATRNLSQAKQRNGQPVTFFIREDKLIREFYDTGRVYFEFINERNQPEEFHFTTKDGNREIKRPLGSLEDQKWFREGGRYKIFIKEQAGSREVKTLEQLVKSKRVFFYTTARHIHFDRYATGGDRHDFRRLSAIDLLTLSDYELN